MLNSYIIMAKMKLLKIHSPTAISTKLLALDLVILPVQSTFYFSTVLFKNRIQYGIIMKKNQV